MINNVILVGRLVRDPEIRESQGGKSVCEITLAVTKPFKNATTHEYDTDFIKCTLWEHLAINVCEYCKKGSTVGIKGRISTKNTTIDSKNISILEIIAEKITFISKKE